MRRHPAAIVALLISAGISPAFGCGHCVEDKIAAVYDYEMVNRAAAAGHAIAYCLIEGRLMTDETRQREIVRSLEATAGVDPGTTRVSPENAALAFAFNATEVPLDAVLRTANGLLARKGINLVPIRVVDRPAEFK
ncbi:MAG TPA: hypothetical protein VMH34_04455 [Gammaproteobacteria bacterium]|nr:hypothetical protein [Gammaproteobacteria bacterium]